MSKIAHLLSQRFSSDRFPGSQFAYAGPGFYSKGPRGPMVQRPLSLDNVSRIAVARGRGVRFNRKGKVNVRKAPLRAGHSRRARLLPTARDE
jgi:hypothetical protein